MRPSPLPHLACEPAEIRSVLDEPALLPPHTHEVWTARHVPRGIHVPFRGGTGTPAPGALDLASLVVRDGADVLTEGRDYVVDSVYGSICLPPDGPAAPRSVSLDYRYSLLRIDSLVQDAETGERRLLRGVSHLTNPHPPRLGPAQRLEANLLVDAFGDGIAPLVFVPGSGSTPATAASGTLPAASARIAAGEPVTVLFLGDSITEGGDASTDASMFRSVVERALVGRFADLVQPTSTAVGGTRSLDWLASTTPEASWSRVERSAPHVTVIEFLNDAYLEPEEWRPAYDDLIGRLHALGSEVVLLTPTFVMRSAMHGDAARDDGRPYVAFVRDYAAEHGLPLVDVSARWEALRDEGLPYWTLLANGINHPDDRGHRLTGDLVAAALLAMLEENEAVAS